MKFGKQIASQSPQPQEGLVETLKDLKDLRLFVLEMALAMHRGETVPLDSPHLLSLFDLPEGTGSDVVLARIKQQCARVVGTHICPECQGRVEVREDLNEGPCPWCGADLDFAANPPEE